MQFTEASNFYFDQDTYDQHIKKKWFIKSDNGADNCCISVSGYTKPMRGRSIVVVLREIDGKWHTMVKKKLTGKYEFPGGGWDEGETPEHAGIRELHEEAQVKIKNVQRIGTQIQFDLSALKVSPWVKQHVKNSDDWWYGYYSAIFIGFYDGQFTGHISEEDFEDSFKWKPLSFVNKHIPQKFKNAIAEYIKQHGSKEGYQEVTLSDLFGDDLYFGEAVDVSGKKFDKAYKAVFNYDNGHMLKLTYSLQGCEITNVGMSKAVRDTVAEVAEQVNKEQHRGDKHTKEIRAFMVALKGIWNSRKRIKQRKKFITEFLNKHIGDVGYLDFQAKGCKVIGIYDLYEKKEVQGEVRTIGIYVARRMESAKRNILSPSDLKKVHDMMESKKKTRFHIATFKTGQIDIYPTFLSTYWDDRGDHEVVDANNHVIEDDSADRRLDGELDNIPDIIGDLEMKGYHMDDEDARRFLQRYRGAKLGGSIPEMFDDNEGDSS